MGHLIPVTSSNIKSPLKAKLGKWSAEQRSIRSKCDIPWGNLHPVIYCHIPRCFYHRWKHTKDAPRCKVFSHISLNWSWHAFSIRLRQHGCKSCNKRRLKNSSATLQQAGDWRRVSEMGRQQGLHLPLALITVKIISDRRLQVEAGEWWGLKVRTAGSRWWKLGRRILKGKRKGGWGGRRHWITCWGDR